MQLIKGRPQIPLRLVRLFVETSTAAAGNSQPKPTRFADWRRLHHRIYDFIIESGEHRVGGKSTRVFCGKTRQLVLASCGARRATAAAQAGRKSGNSFRLHQASRFASLPGLNVSYEKIPKSLRGFFNNASSSVFRMMQGAYP